MSDTPIPESELLEGLERAKLAPRRPYEFWDAKIMSQGNIVARAEGEHQPENCPHCAAILYLQAAANQHESMARELLARRKAMEDAPHDWLNCAASGHVLPRGDCNCWKSKWSAE